MHPALSVIFFTTLSGMGYGLWIWFGLCLALGPARVAFEPILWFVIIAAGAVLSATGLVASFLHLGKPLRAWRAFSQWRTSWLSREGVLAMACFMPAALLLLQHGSGLAVRLLGLLLALLSCGTVVCTAMIYASLKPIPAWRHRLVVPVYVVFALLTGGIAFLPATLASNEWPWFSSALLVLTILIVLMKWKYWRAIDHTSLPLSTGAAVGLPKRTVNSFEQPHTEANYITREMGFVVARRHARILRIMVIVLLFVTAVILFLMPGGLWVAFLAVFLVFAAAFIERWLFFAQARHMVMLYY